MLFGGSTPFLLRPATTEGEYRLVGEAYVYGLMDGEALDPRMGCADSEPPVLI